MFQKFLDAGLCVIPLKGGLPQVEWSKYFFNLPTDVSGWKSDEYALVCGAVSKVIAVDIDSEELADRIYSFSGPTYVRKKGSKGFTAFYKYNGEISQNWKDAHGNVICEILTSDFFNEINSLKRIPV
jgi:CTP:phosphocholine cytidylyltransferase-like protein